MTTEDEGFTPAQRSQLAEMIATAVKGAAPPPGPIVPATPPKLSDDEWLGMSIGQREAWVRRSVEGELLRIQKEDDQLRLSDEVEKMRAKLAAEPEKAPSAVDKIREFLWGKEPEKAPPRQAPAR
jgi:hypothetical protein